MFKYFLPLVAASIFLSTGIACGQENDRFKIDFPGGTVDSYIQLLRDTAPKDRNGGTVNLVIPDTNSRSISLPSIEVETNLEGALDCLVACSNKRYDFSFDRGGDHGEITFVRVVDRSPPSITPAETSTVQVFNLVKILKDLTKENVVSAIDLGLEISGAAKKVEIKLHEETGLLFARGPKSQLEIIEQVVNELASTSNNANLNQHPNMIYQPVPYNGSAGPTYYTPIAPYQYVQPGVYPNTDGTKREPRSTHESNDRPDSKFDQDRITPPVPIPAHEQVAPPQETETKPPIKK